MALEGPFSDPDDPELNFDLVAASLRADATDVNTFVEALAVKLESTLGQAVEIKRERKGFRGPREVREIAIKAGGDRLDLRRDGNLVECVRARTSGGIVIKTERMEVDDWLLALARILGVESQRSEQTRQALERLLDI
jgi:hypothetical protein